MKRLLPSILALACGLFLFGCASVGNNFNEANVSQIQKGVSTEADLVGLFGEPQNRSVNSEGQTILTWIYSEATVKGESFIPYAGMFMGGTNSKNKSLNVTLQNGVVTSYAMTGGGMEQRNMTQETPK